MRMNPLKKIQYNAPATLSFAFLSLGALLSADLTGNQTTLFFFSIYRAPITDPLLYMRLFGHVLGHADISHYFNNFMLILLVGPMLEEKYGSKNIAFIMGITALVTGLIFMAFSAHDILLGASGIAFMLILLSSFANWQKGRIPLTLVLALVIFIGREVIAGALSPGGNISHMTHIIGGLCGAVFGFALNRK